MDLKKILKSKKIIIGTEKSVKELKRGKLEKIFTSANCPKDVKKDIDHYSKLSDVELVLLEQENDELGVLCKKPFPISVLGLAK